MKELSSALIKCAKAILELASQMGVKENVIDSMESVSDGEKLITNIETARKNIDMALAAVELAALEKLREVILEYYLAAPSQGEGPEGRG